jgi:hypothetical protein
MNKTRKQSQTIRQPVFNASDFQSNDGMLTTIWGPPMWHFLHSMSFNYPVKPTVQQKRHYRDFILSLQHILPCGKCRENLKSNFKKLPLTMKAMENRETFSRYVYDLHELINTMLHKKSGLTYDQVRERYEHFRSRCTTTVKKKLRRTKQKRKQKEKGCTDPLTGEKSKCVLHIVPKNTQCETFKMDSKCEKVRINLDD